MDGESFSPGDDSLFDSALHEDQGSNLVDSRPSVVIQQPILLDLPRDQVERGLFESYTDTGTLFSELTNTHISSPYPPISALSHLSLSLSMFSGIFSPLLSFRPFSLRSGSRYMLEVTASRFPDNNSQFMPKCEVSSAPNQ